jgi:hypothetical protein
MQRINLFHLHEVDEVVSVALMRGQELGTVIYHFSMVVLPTYMRTSQPRMVNQHSQDKFAGGKNMYHLPIGWISN